jgi:ABC-type Fe3+-siderophore transport system permease subunit
VRKRWEFNPWPFVALWVVGGLIALFVVAALTNGCRTYDDGSKSCGVNGPMSGATILTICIWLGPFALALLGSIIFQGIPLMLNSLWEARPRRVSEPVRKDLRRVHPPE